MYRRVTNFAFDGFRNLTCKILTQNPIRQEICSKATQASSTSLIPNPRFSGYSLSSLVSKQNHFHNFSTLGRRYYYVDRYQVYHFKPRGPKRWFSDTRTMFIMVVVGSGLVITVYFGNLETIPYTKRSHFVLLSKNVEKQLGESQFEQMKKGFKGKILPPFHPESIRVRVISKDIIDALKRGLHKEHGWSDLEYASEGSTAHPDRGFETNAALTEGSEEKIEGSFSWRKEEELLDDSWVKESRKRSIARGAQPATQHLEGLNWEVLVVNEPIVNAFCLPGGKIVVFTGLLDHFKSDAEIATIIGHEVSHAIARHAAEQITKNLWLAIIQLVLYQFITPDMVNAMSTLLLRLPFSRRMEIEADYIGLLLMASAGYDPRVAPRVYEKLGKVTGESSLRDYLSTHPSGKKRALLLARAQVMEEALQLYQEAKEGHGVQGFL
ncbi:Peptidase M48 [Dillenia turbinata]|uniref:Peptidase M48 n=1 Tax=Dillenia turbinata TaxID=194707 RepID=A0AAN8VA48_9MAGN